MFKQFFTALKTRLPRRGRTKESTPSLKEIQRLLKQVMDSQAIVAKRQITWQAEQEVRQANIEGWQADLENWQTNLEKWQAKINRDRAKDKKYLNDVGRTAGGLGNNVGRVTEEFFASAVIGAMPFIIQEIAFNTIFVNQRFIREERKMECDIVLVNQQHIAIIEAKHFLEPRHVVEFDRKLREILPKVLPDQYRHLHLVPVMACMSLHQLARAQAGAYGFALLRPHDQQSRVESDRLRLRPPMNQQY